MLRQISKALIASLSLCVPAAASAGVVSQDEARELAAEFFSSSGVERLATSASLKLAFTAQDKQKPLYYVFNAVEGEGFIIVSADDCTVPVLGYSTDSHYSSATLPSAMKWMISGLENEIRIASDVQPSQSSTARRSQIRKAAQSTERIVLQTAQWSQEGPFNNAIPGRPLVGCVGTAMGIVMRYHQWPERGFGSHNNVNFDVEYAWANMRLDNYRSSYTPTEANAVATLLYHTATSVGTQFGMSGSSAYEVRIPAAMTNYFGYDPGISYKKRSETSSQAVFDAIIRDEINNRRPVIFCGQDVTAGHAFVVDGFDPATNMLHINWGWGGQDGNTNGGWYVSTALNPSVSVNHSFNNLATIIYNIKPATGSNSNWSPIHITADGGQIGMGSDVTVLASGNTFTVRVGNLKNVSYNDFAGKMAVALFASTGEFKTLLSAPQSLSLQGMAYLFNGFTTFSGCKLPEGTAAEQNDVIRIATSNDGSTTWLPVPGELLTVNEIPAVRTAPDCFNITLPTSSEVSVQGENKVIRGWDYKFRVEPSDPTSQIVTVKANGYVVTPREGTYDYTISNVRDHQDITLLVQAASEVKAKRSIWVSEPGTLRNLLSEGDAAAVKDLTLFGSINATDFEYMRSGMRLTRLDISSVYISAHGSDQAYALPRNAFQGQGQLSEVILPNNLNRINNGAFRSCGITSIIIPAGVKTYEYNVFLGASKLRDIWVGRETAEFINWCVLSGTNKGAMTLHVPSQAAVNNYSNKENWKEIGTIIVDPIPAVTDYLFAVADNGDVKFDCDDAATIPSRYAKGTVFRFKAQHIADNDDRMEVYANTTLLTPDADGTYSVTVNGNTLVHFDLIKPLPVSQYASEMQLTNTGGTVGLLTDAVNVFEGVPFTIRANAFKVPVDMGSFFWAAVLTDAQGSIKEFISPVATWPSSTTGDGLKMNVNCCVNKATVREGNKIRLATSYNNKTWALVKGATNDVTDALEARNNQTPVYNITFPELRNANVSGVVATAVHGRDITIRVSPKNARDRINMSINGEIYATDATSVEYSFIAKQDMNFDVEVKTPPVPDVKTYEVNGNLQAIYTDANAGVLPERVIITGTTTASILQQAFQQYNIRTKIKSLDISNLRVYESTTSTVEILGANSFGTSGNKNTVLEELILPSTITKLGDYSLNYCTALKEITLPASLSNIPGSTYSIGYSVFDGSTNLTTIYIPGDLEEYYGVTYVSHFSCNGQSNGARLASTKFKLWYDAGIEPEVTVVVPEKWLPYYKDKTGDITKNKSYEWNHYKYGNPWLLDGYNILSENPVYSLNFDPARLRATDDFDLSDINFLRKNVQLETIGTAGKLFLTADPATKVRVFDNGKVMPSSAIGDDRSVDVVFHNPKFETGLQGNHDVRVRYYYDVKFNLSSNLFEVTPAELRNDGQTTFETWNTNEAAAPVLTDVEENTTVRFRLEMKDSNPDIIAKVKAGEQVLTPDEEGFYSLDVTDCNLNVDVYAVPSNGATISEEEFKSIDAHEATEVVTLSLTGDIAVETLAGVMDGFSSLEELDLSEMTSALPEEAFKDAEGLKIVTLPNIETIPAGTFTGCSNLTTVTVPECVNEVGANAFNGCTALESVALSGINGIGENAFAGCDNMKCIYINAASDNDGRLAPQRTSRKSDSYSAKAFQELNPNCIIVLGENVEQPSAPGNYIITTTGMIEDIDAEGNTIQREGRIYTATGHISLIAGQPFESPYKFSMRDNETISLSVPVAEFNKDGGWSSLVTPFDTEIPEGYEVCGVTEEKGFVKGLIVKAYQPYLIRRIAEGGAEEVTLSSKPGAMVDATPEILEAVSNEFVLAATMKQLAADCTQTFRLNAAGSAFEHAAANGEIARAAENDTEEDAVPIVALDPFEVYAKSNYTSSQIPITFDNIPTGIAVTGFQEKGLNVYRNGNILVVESDKDMELPVYDLTGRLCGTLTIKAGTNTFQRPATGQMCVIGNIKVIF